MDYFLFIDEAGCLGALPSPNSDIQPAFCLAGLIVPTHKTKLLTRKLIDIKRTYCRDVTALGHYLDAHLKEIKGSELRRDLFKSHNHRTRAISIMDQLLGVCQDCHASIIAKIFIKCPGGDFNGKAIYTSTIQALAGHFQAFLSLKKARGLMILDSRKHHQNTNVSFSIFTQMYKSDGNRYPQLQEAPLFGHSENISGLQMVDLLCSAFLTPIAIQTYCKNHIGNIHTQRDYGLIKNRYAENLRKLQFRYQSDAGWRGGISVADGILKSRNSSHFFDLSTVPAT